MKNFYNITPEKYKKLLTKQNNLCAICKTNKPGGEGVWHIDRNHETGGVKGILCYHCNTSLGGFKYRPRILIELSII